MLREQGPRLCGVQPPLQVLGVLGDEVSQDVCQVPGAVDKDHVVAGLETGADAHQGVKVAAHQEGDDTAGAMFCLE